MVTCLMLNSKEFEFIKSIISGMMSRAEYSKVSSGNFYRMYILIKI